MASPLTPDDAEDDTGKKENFVGRVVGSSVEGHPDAYLEDGNSPSGRSFESDVPQFSHFAYIEVLDDTYDKNQNIFNLDVRKGRETKWMVMMAHLYSIHGEEWEESVEDHTDIPDFIEGRVYEWRDVAWTEGESVPGLGVTYQEVGRGKEQIKPMLVPIREVTDEDELSEHGSGEDVEPDTSVEL